LEEELLSRRTEKIGRSLEENTEARKDYLSSNKYSCMFTDEHDSA
jgi:hypothetical protein